MAGIEPPAAAVPLGTASAIPHIVVPIPGGEGRSVVLRDEGIVGQISRETVQVEFEVLCFILDPAGGMRVRVRGEREGR